MKLPEFLFKFISPCIALLIGASTHAYECDGRTRCSRMTSCAEATWFLNNCPGTEMDGDGDGVPCEKQWCGHGASSEPVTVQQPREIQTPIGPTSTFNNTAPIEDAVSKAFRDRSKDVQLIGSGTVTKVLSDDNEGGRHQRFIVRTDSGISVLIAHNIDLAPRINELRSGEKVTFYGEYVWNEKGGVIHWTHHDPAGVHKAGWIKHNGNKYQ